VLGVASERCEVLLNYGLKPKSEDLTYDLDQCLVSDGTDIQQCGPRLCLQSVTCFYHYGIAEYSTVHFSVTLQSKF